MCTLIDPQHKAKIKWRCRRGMLELDLIFNRFVDEKLYLLDETRVRSFELLLECIDPEIFAWIMGYEQPNDQELIDIVDLIKQHHQSNKIS